MSKPLDRRTALAALGLTGGAVLIGTVASPVAATPPGTNGSQVVPVSHLTDLMGRPGSTAEPSVLLAGYFEGTLRGGGRFTWDASLPHAQHDGGRVISPSVPWDGVRATLADYLAGQGETQPTANGCWVRDAGWIRPADYGAAADGISDDAVPIAAAIAAAADASISVDFEGLHYLITAGVTVTGADYDVVGNGAVIHRSGQGPNRTSIFLLRDAHRMAITGFTLSGEHSSTMVTSGSSPIIQVGSTDRADETVCEDIEIHGNTITGSNWAGVVIYGNRGAAGVTKNRHVWVHHNTIGNTNSGVFVYKNASDILVEDNVLTDLGNDGVIFDTRAGSDDRDSEANIRLCVRNNIITDFAKFSLGIGILLKGLNHDATIVGNVIVGASATQTAPQDNWGILVEHDFSGNGPRNIVVNSNVVRDIKAPAGKNGFGINVYTGTDVQVKDNNILDCQTYASYIISTSGIDFSGNRISNCGGSGFAVRIDGTAATPTVDFTCSGNTMSRGDASPLAAIYLGFVTTGQVRDNIISGCSGDVAQTANASDVNSATRFTIASQVVVPGQTFRQTVDLPGAMPGDFALVSHNNPSGAELLIVTGNVYLKNKVNLSLHNPSSAAVTVTNATFSIATIRNLF